LKSSIIKVKNKSLIYSLSLSNWLLLRGLLCIIAGSVLPLSVRRNSAIMLVCLEGAIMVCYYSSCCCWAGLITVGSSAISCCCCYQCFIVVMITNLCVGEFCFLRNFVDAIVKSFSYFLSFLINLSSNNIC
jgi:hypothetical protein